MTCPNCGHSPYSPPEICPACLSIVRVAPTPAPAAHQPTEHCPEDECEVCGRSACPHGDPMHYHHDGCPSCCEAPPTGVEREVCVDIAARQRAGIQKYGTTVADNPLRLEEWLQHAYEECLDQAVYLKRAIQECRTKPTTEDQR